MVKISNETLDGERKELIKTFSQYLTDNTEWMRGRGIEPGGRESVNPSLAASNLTEDGKVKHSDFPRLPGSDCSYLLYAKADGKYRYGAALFKSLSEAVQRRRIPVLWDARAIHLLTRNGSVCGVKIRSNGKEYGIRASRAVILTCGGFEFNEWMKENYLRLSPAHFYGNPGNTGDGINMTLEIGAALWHMNNASWRVIMKFPDFPIAFSIQHHTDCILVDRRGRRFANERFKQNAFGYELTNYDTQAMFYPKVPCYWIFDERRRAAAPLAGPYGPSNPPGGIEGESYYVWSQHNQKEIDRGWVIRAASLEDLAQKLSADPDNGGSMSSSILQESIRRYNDHCKRGEDPDYQKPKEWLRAVEGPPYYAVKLWPGGPNTQGGPRRNLRGQVLRPDNRPIPRLYSAGELGSVWGMLYQGGGNLAECVAYGRISGSNAAAESRSH
jgi:succinate dehydrogenase/fumarate reductase flavoprotein subunit